MLMAKSVDTSEKMVCFTKLISQLLSGKVILQKLPAVRGNLHLITSRISECEKKNEEMDEFFFKEPGKKCASKISKPFCSKCNKTVNEYKTRDKYCKKCGTTLLFKCMTCNKQYNSYVSMMRHLKYKCKKPYLQHSKCNYRISNKQGFSKHLQHKHIKSENENHKECLKCGKKYKHSWNLSNHIKFCKNTKFIPDAEKFSKQIKNKVKKNKSVTINNNNAGYSVTLIQINGSKMVKLYCSRCNITTNNKPLNTLKNCQKCDSLLLLQCKKCNKRYLNPNSMKYHLKSKCSPKAYYKCLKCNYGSPIKELMNNHIKSLHTVVDPNYFEICLKCGTKLKNIDNLRRHVKFCGKEPDLQCPFCSYKTKFKTNLRLHLKVHSEINNIDINNLIEKSTNEASKTRNIINSSQKNEETMLTADALGIIMEYCLTCNKEKDIVSNKTCRKCGTLLLFKCKKCSRQYNNYNHILTHAKYTHKRTNLIRCVKCFKEFTKLHSMKVHLKYCQTETSLNCQYCSYATKYSQNLKSHQQRMHLTCINNAKRKTGNTMKKDEAIAPGRDTVYIIKKQERDSRLTIHKISEKYCAKCDETFKGNSKKSCCHKCGIQLLHECINCNRRYEHVSSLIYHIRSQCNPEAQYSCSKCNFTRSIRATVKKHIKKQHPSFVLQ